jgi:hypothetical protein
VRRVVKLTFILQESRVQSELSGFGIGNPGIVDFRISPVDRDCQSSTLVPQFASVPNLVNVTEIRLLAALHASG